jgi:kanamycin kinase
VPLAAPEPLRTTYAAWQWTVVWEWPDQSTTWRLVHPGDDLVRFLKVSRSGHFPTPMQEAERMRWARASLPVPEVIDAGTDGDLDWIATTALPGTDATRHPWKADPERLVPVLARGLAAFHRAAPAERCPFQFTTGIAIGHARARVERGIATAADLHPEHQHLTIEEAVAELERLAPDREDLVVCHGDYCLPNVLLDDAGAVTGYVDLGELGVADRWWDIAVGAWSVTWNLGPGWEELFYDAYGVEPDEQRIAFYRLLYDLAS